MSGNEFRFFLSCDINLPVTFRIERLEGTLRPPKSPSSGTFYLNFPFGSRETVSFNHYSSIQFSFCTADVDPTSKTEERRAELYVECALYIDGAPFGLPTRTRFFP